MQIRTESMHLASGHPGLLITETRRLTCHVHLYAEGLGKRAGQGFGPQTELPRVPETRGTGEP